MSETRILQEAEKLEEIQLTKDVHKTLLAVEKDIFSEDEIILLRGYREDDNDFIRQIKKENSL